MLPPESTARIVIDVGTPAMIGPVMVLKAKPFTPAGITWMAGLVVPVIEPFVRSDTETVCDPTVFRVTVTWRKPLESVPDVGEAV